MTTISLKNLGDIPFTSGDRVDVYVSNGGYYRKAQMRDALGASYVICNNCKRPAELLPDRAFFGTSHSLQKHVAQCSACGTTEDLGINRTDFVFCRVFHPPQVCAIAAAIAKLRSNAPPAPAPPTSPSI